LPGVRYHIVRGTLDAWVWMGGGAVVQYGAKATKGGGAGAGEAAQRKSSAAAAK